MEALPGESPLSKEPSTDPELENGTATAAGFLANAKAFVPVAVLGIFLILLTAFLFWSKPFTLPVVLAILISFLLRPLVKFLARLRVPEILGSVLVIAVFFTIVGAVATRLAQPAADWVGRAPETLRQIEQKFHNAISSVTQLSRAAERVENITSERAGAAPPQKIEVKQGNFGLTIFAYTSSFITAVIETIVLVFFFLALGDMFVRKLVRILPTQQDKQRALEITHELQHSVSVFLFTITCINATLGILVGFFVMLVGMPNPVLWGVVAALLNFIPYFGPWMGVAILALAGFVEFDSVGRALMPPTIYLALHALESNFLTPIILGRRLTMNPVVIFLALMFWMWLWGIPGALISIPLLMMFKVFCDHFKPLGPVGEFISGMDPESRTRWR